MSGGKRRERGRRAPGRESIPTVLLFANGSRIELPGS